jgi:hypothetical protein
VKLGTKAPSPIRVFIVLITCSNVPNLGYSVPCAVEDGHVPLMDSTKIINSIRLLNSGELKDNGELNML